MKKKYIFLFSFFLTGSLSILFSNLILKKKQPSPSKSILKSKDDIATSLTIKGYEKQLLLDFDLSKVFFEKALINVPSRTPQKDMIEEACFSGLFLNYFYQNDPENAEQILFKLSNKYPLSNNYKLLSGLLLYLKHQYQEALSELTQYHVDNSLQSEIHKNIIAFYEKYFNIIKAHCLMETGFYTESRLILRKQIQNLIKQPNFLSSKEHNFILILLGKSYLLEAKTISSPSIIENYKMFLFYTQKNNTSIITNDYQCFSNEILPLIFSKISLIPTNSQNLIVDLLVFLKKHNILDNSYLIEELLNLINNPIIDINNLLNLIVEQESLSQICHLLSEKLLLLFQKSIDSIEIVNAKTYLNSLKTLENQNIILNKIHFCPEKLKEMLLNSSDTCEKLKQYLMFWDNVLPYEMDKQQLLHTLSDVAKTLWLKNYDDIVFQLLDAILTFSNNSMESESLVQNFLNQAYSKSLSSHNIQRLFDIDAFISEKHLQPTQILQRQICNFFADAEYLFSLGKYDKSILYCKWLISVSSKPQFYKLLGLCYTEKHLYNEAIDCFSKIKPNDKFMDIKTQKAISLCLKHLSKEDTVN